MFGTQKQKKKIDIYVWPSRWKEKIKPAKIILNPNKGGKSKEILQRRGETFFVVSDLVIIVSFPVWSGMKRKREACASWRWMNAGPVLLLSICLWASFYILFKTFWNGMF